MTRLDQSKRQRTIDRLDAVLDRAELPSRAHSSGQSLLDKLGAPTRIGFFGLPGTGKTRLLEALARLPEIGAGQPLPTFEVSHGASPETEAMLPDGTFVTASRLPDAALLAKEPVFLRLKAPSQELRGRTYLLVATEASDEDLLNGLSWAALRVDLSVWCSHDWTPLEQQVWSMAPDPLRNHAVFVGTGPRMPGFEQPQLHCFDASFHIPVSSDAGMSPGSDGLAEHLDRLIDDAAMHDLNVAEMFLQRYGPSPEHDIPNEVAEPLGAETPRPPPTARSPHDPDGDPERSAQLAPSASPEARAELTRLFQMLRQTSADLYARVHINTPSDVRLAAIEELFEDMLVRSTDMIALEDHFPEVQGVLSDAYDLALLLRVEGGEDQVTDAARLVVQVRRDMEMRLAA